mmetsp:Transcript_16209/g.22400  ORF Transcript_16209/g.22400 Transcript_16209/m.22400 type:complete len:243 (+) Transcript_16209:132-860(+)
MSLKEELKKAGLTRVLFIRHANASPLGSKPKSDFHNAHDWKQNDQVRPLTDKGKEQAEEARRWFIEGVGLANNKVLVSSGARRAAETLQIMAERRESGTADVSIEMIPSLHPAGIAEPCELLFDRINYAPLTRYYAEEGGAKALEDYGLIVLGEFREMLARVSSKPGDTISMFGHAVFMNAAAMEFAKALDFPAKDIKNLTEVALGESEGISIECKEGAYKVLHMHTRGLASSNVTGHPLFG